MRSKCVIMVDSVIKSSAAFCLLDSPYGANRRTSTSRSLGRGAKGPGRQHNYGTVEEQAKEAGEIGVGDFGEHGAPV